MICGRENMTYPCLCNEISDVLIDDTFKCCAKFFLEIYNIHGLCNGHYVSLVFMLLSGKSEIIYCSMWSAIRCLCERHNLCLESTTVHIDVEVTPN